MTTHTNILARRIPYREGSGGLPWNHKKSDMAECLSTNLIPFVIDNKILQNVAYDYYSCLILYTLPTTHGRTYRWLSSRESSCKAGDTRSIPLEEEMATHSSILV